MLLKSLIGFNVLACAILLAGGRDNPSVPSNLSAIAIADKNVAARGGLQAWQAVKSLSMLGKMAVGGNQRATLAVPMPDSPNGRPTQAIKLGQRPAQELQLPFVMELERPHKMRFELQFKGETAVQVYDGANGWKLRPYLNRKVVEPYTPDELKVASTQADLDGYLIDYGAKGTRVELLGMEKVEDRDTYKLKATTKNGSSVNVWIDGQTFLETKIQGTPRRLDGVDHPVEVYYRDYRLVNGLQIPHVMETHVLPAGHTAMGLKETLVPPEKTTIERVLVNAKLDDAHFAKPQVDGLRSAK
jgi:hypothetical protein